MHYSKMTSFPVYSIFGLACASAFTSFHVCTWSSWGIQCENTLFKSLQICSTHATPHIDWDTMYVDSLVDFWMGEWTKGYLVQAQLPHWRNQKDNTPERSSGCLGSMTLNGVHNKTMNKTTAKPGQMYQGSSFVTY